MAILPAIISLGVIIKNIGGFAKKDMNGSLMCIIAR
jgi:hypothetical protein